MPDVPIISRVYEERFMRESMSGEEKDCMMGEACECMLIDASRPFVCTQFVIPNVSNEHQGMCVLCLRKTTQLLYYKTIYNGVNVNTLIQKYGNICNQPGEYHPSVMLICPANGPVHTMPGALRACVSVRSRPRACRRCPRVPVLPANTLAATVPIMSHQRNRYAVDVISGVKHLKQIKVGMQDFQ